MTEKLSTISIFRAKAQPATRYRCDVGFWIKNKTRSLARCWNCRKLRWCANLVVQSYYDGDRFFCKEVCK